MQKALLHFAILCLISISCFAQYTYELQPHFDCGYDASVIKEPTFEIVKPTFKREMLAMKAWTWKGTPSFIRSYLNFPDLQYLLQLGIPLQNANLKLYNYQYIDGSNLSHQTREYCNSYYLNRVTEYWDENIKWINQPMVSNGLNDFDYIEVKGNQCLCPIDSCEFYDDAIIDITPIAKWWQNNTNKIYGLQLKLVDEIIYNRKVFSASDANNPSDHPMLTLIFDEELRILDRVYYINSGEILILNGSIEQASYNWDTQNNNPYFVINEPGFYGVSVTLPNCFEFRNEFEVRLNPPNSLPFNPTIQSINDNITLPNSVKPQQVFNSKPIKKSKSTTFTLFDANGTPIFTSEQVPKDIYDLKSKFNLNKGLYLYKTVEQDVRRNTIISKSGKFFNL